MIMELLRHKDYIRVLRAVGEKPRRFSQLQKSLRLNPTQVDRALGFLRKGLFVIARTMPTGGSRILLEYDLGKRGAAFLQSLHAFSAAAEERKAALGASEVAELRSIYR